MMASKPTEEKGSAPPDFAIQKSAPTQGSVEDLQRRLAMIGAEEQDSKPPAAIAPPSAATENLKPAPVASVPQGGKNALLARIMAAKEKSQQAQAKVAPAPPPAQPEDLLMDFDAPASEKDPPPMYNTNFAAMAPPAPPAMQDMAPPAFDTVENNVIQQAFLPPPPIDAVAAPPPPLPPTAFAPPAASAPSFESLMVNNSNNNSYNGMQAMPPPPPASQEYEIDDSILAALSPEERAELLEEQRQIMEQIEKNKQNNEASSAAARAMAFNQRSSAAVANLAASMDGGSSSSRAFASSTSSRSTSSRPATSASGGNTVDLGHGESVPLHGQERTQQAIKDGTAVIVQCMSCNNWMQVTEAASLMFCPICQVVCPVEKAGAATSADMEAAAQLAADAKLAEELQKEEYKKAGGGGEQRPARRQKPKPAPQQEQSWYDWIVGAPGPAPAAAAAPARGSAEIRNTSRSSGPRLVAAQTGDETQGLISRTDGARVAQQKGMFACVADSVSAAAEQMTAYTLPQDGEGNVHGVDSSSLLAMPDVSRQREM